MHTYTSLSCGEGSHAKQQLLATDYLPTIQKTDSFADRVKALQLSVDLTNKINELSCNYTNRCVSPNKQRITSENEIELASEVLLARHDFTNQLLNHPIFRQAALSVIQNIYLFKQRKLFFHTNNRSTEMQRQMALKYFSNSKTKNIPLVDTLQHPIVARIWRKIINSRNIETLGGTLTLLHRSVERLNTLRNCYMILSTGLARKAATKQPSLYMEGLPFEDAVQVGIMGIGRAAYRYHPSFGVRFSTYATNYINREIQQQALNARFIRISSNTIEKFQHAFRNEQDEHMGKQGIIIQTSSVRVGFDSNERAKDSTAVDSARHLPSIADRLEQQELCEIIQEAIDSQLSTRAADFLKRRYGFHPYGEEQSIMAISQAYGITRSAVYQLERSAIRRLHDILAARETSSS